MSYKKYNCKRNNCNMYTGKMKISLTILKHNDIQCVYMATMLMFRHGEIDNIIDVIKAFLINMYVRMYICEHLFCFLLVVSL